MFACASSKAVAYERVRTNVPRNFPLAIFQFSFQILLHSLIRIRIIARLRNKASDKLEIMPHIYRTWFSLFLILIHA